MAQDEKVFIKGMIFKAPRAKAPSFVKGSLSIKVEELVPFLQEHSKNGWVNINLKESRGGKYYAELDTWQPKSTEKEDREYDRRADEAMDAMGGGTEEIAGADDIPY